ncbi:MAG: hypothetical protein SF028_01160 [Candidatus Sumerlaeia bacterium]|nr:hypothetical protein [Candidatus Sumerlaeia bacterium]
MPARFWGGLFRRAPLPDRGLGVEGASQRYAEWLSRARNRTIAPGMAALDDAEESITELLALPEPPAQGLSDAAAFLGESLRAECGGAWREDARWGLVLGAVGGVRCFRFRPLEAVEKKRELGPAFALAGTLRLLPERVEKERALGEPFPGAPAPPPGPAEAAAAWATWFGDGWRARFGQPLAPNLRGVRELDRYLRTQYLLMTAPDSAFAGAGFFLGEVARGLFGGEWRPWPAEEPWKAALAWPELPYYPAGRVFKMLSELPEAEPLDEYVRLVPSARKELRGGP